MKIEFLSKNPVAWHLAASLAALNGPKMPRVLPFPDCKVSFFQPRCGYQKRLRIEWMEQPKFSYLFPGLLPRQRQAERGRISSHITFHHFKKISKQSRIHAMTTQLVELAEVERLSSVVIRVLGGNPGKVCILSFL